MLLPTHPASSAGNRAELGGSRSSGVTPSRKGIPSSSFHLREKAEAVRPGACPGLAQPSLPARPAEGQCHDPGAQRGEGPEAGAERRLEPRGRAWRGRGRSACTLFAPGPFPSDRPRPMAGRKMAARSATDSHVSPRYRRAPPPPPGESPTPWEALPGQPLGGKGISSAGAGEGKGAAAEGHHSPHAAPNPGAGVLRRKPYVGQPAPARATGHAQFRPKPRAPGFLATPRDGRGGGRGPGGAGRLGGVGRLAGYSWPRLPSANRPLGAAPQVAPLLWGAGRWTELENGL